MLREDGVLTEPEHAEPTPTPKINNSPSSSAACRRWRISFAARSKQGEAIMSDETEDDNCAAYHEAGHTVAGYQFGWYLRHWSGCVGSPSSSSGLHTPEINMVVSLAGWVADTKFSRLPKSHSFVAYGEILYELQRLRNGRPQLVAQGWDSDPRSIAAELIKENPRITDRGVAGSSSAFSADRSPC